MAFNPELGSTSPAVLLDNAERLDKLVNGPELTEPDRAGVDLDTWRGMMAKNDEIRQNLIPLSKQYMTLAAAQADIANIPEGSTTYYRSPDDSALAVEVMNVSGTLQPTSRKMPSSMPMGYQSATAVSSSAANAIAITIPGLLVDSSLIYFLSPILNTAEVSVTVTDARGNSVTRAIQKQNNAALVGNELLLNQPALMEFRTGTANNFVLVASGPVAAELATRISTLELNSVALLYGVTNTGDAYSGTASTIPGIVASDRVFLFTPSATNTTRTPTL
ncbi:hypothetical protein WJH49_005581, partial [Klebsiella pneumoniae]